DRCRDAASLGRGVKLVNTALLRIDHRFGEGPPIEARLHQVPCLPAEVLGKTAAVARADDLLRGVPAEKPGRKRNTGNLGFEATRRQGNAEAPYVPRCHALQGVAQ